MAFDLYCQLISLAPIYHMLCRLAAAHAYIGDILLLKGYAARADAGLFLDLVLASLIAAPHCTHKAVSVLLESLDYLVDILAGICPVLAVFKSLTVHTVASLFELLCNGLLELTERAADFFTAPA